MSANEHNDTFPETGLLVLNSQDKLNPMASFAHAVVDDLLYNIIHDIVLQTHREEKIARATSAAIVVEKRAAETDPNDHDDTSVLAGNNIKPHVVETESATYNSGEVYLKGNPLKTTTEILCSKCGLPRLLHPTDGNGAKRPEPGVEYCKKRPFIDKPHHDVYGQTFVPEGPGRGKKKKDMIDPLKQLDGTPNGSQDSPGTSPPPGEGPAKPIPFPHAKCINCNTFLPIKRMNNHMNKCIGGNGRESSRNALNKIQNGNSNGSQNGFTPPGSRNATPVPSSKNRHNSPSKRSADDAFGSDDSPEKKQKKPLKKTPASKLKAPKMAKSASSHSASGLSFEQKPPLSDAEDDEDDDRDGDFNGKDTISVEAKKKNKLKPPKPTISKKPLKTKNKWLYGSKSGLGNTVPPALPPDVKKSRSEINGKGGIKRGESESSQTLSSPNVD